MHPPKDDKNNIMKSRNFTKNNSTADIFKQINNNFNEYWLMLSQFTDLNLKWGGVD